MLRELNAVAVRVEDVDEAHLAGEVEDDTNLDTLLTQLVGLDLHVGDVDHRDAPFARLTLGERNAHRSVLELRPLVVPVDEGLLEAEHALVESAAEVEIADEVPDARRRLAHSARAGSSTNCLTVRRKSAPSAPSTARWSTVSVIVSIGRISTAPFRATGVSTVAPTARIAACGGLITATNCSMPNMPRFEIVNVPSSRSCVVSLFSRARPTISPRAFAISARDCRSTERNTGTTSPCGAATAIPTFAVGNFSSASSVYCTFTSR